jgi:tetratricopeptide (TPR) repeat protein
MDQTTESFLRTEAIFSEALAAPLEARAALIEGRAKGDRELEAEVRSLLEACEAEERLTAARRREPEAGREAAAESRRIGPYGLDRLLGRGGMGAVYLAHRADGNFEQKVAIKLIDLPLATAIFRERFRQERQILAGLQHPYIARLLDGGVTAGGDLYLTMEYVDGVPIHRYCEENRLTQPRRLALFLRVCEAVEFAHQNFVVHRDLKPDNILVAADGTPRLLDFGTAKLLSPAPGAPGGQLTREGYQSFTPQYASPEQVLGHQVTAASDTYSLGVLLYLLLTGTLPYELKELSTGEMLRAICEEPPRRPSPAAGRGKRLDADLEAILLKALRKEPRERYLTAEQFAADVRAYLDGRPVGARQGTLRYRASKFIHRNRLALAGAALLAITLMAGIAGVLWQARVANRERRKAEARSADLRQLSNSLLSELDEAIKQLPGSTGAQKLLVTRVLEHLDRMAKDAQGDRQTQLDLANAYTQLAAIQDDPYAQNLGDSAGALASIDKAIALAAPLASDPTKDREAARALAMAEQLRSTILWLAGRTPEAVPAMQSALKIFDALLADPHASPELIVKAANAYNVLGDELGQAGAASLNDMPDALAAYRKNLGLVDRALSIDPDLMPAKRTLLTALTKIGDAEIETDPAQALKDYRIALQRADALPKAEHESLNAVRAYGGLHGREANALVQLGEYSRATDIYEEVSTLDRRLVAEDPKDFRALADLEVDLNAEAEGFEDAADPALAADPGDRRRNLAAAEKLLTQVAAIMEKATRLDPTNEAWKAIQADAQVRLATIQTVLHNSGDSGALAKTGIAALRDLARKDQAPPLVLDGAARDFLKVEPASLRDPQFAVSCAEREVALSHRQSPSALLTLAQAYRASGQTEKSRATAKEGLALLPAPQPGGVKPNIRKLLEIQAQTVG